MIGNRAVGTECPTISGISRKSALKKLFWLKQVYLLNLRYFIEAGGNLKDKNTKHIVPQDLKDIIKKELDRFELQKLPEDFLERCIFIYTMGKEGNAKIEKFRQMILALFSIRADKILFSFQRDNLLWFEKNLIRAIKEEVGNGV